MDAGSSRRRSAVQILIFTRPFSSGIRLRSRVDQIGRSCAGNALRLNRCALARSVRHGRALSGSGGPSTRFRGGSRPRIVTGIFFTGATDQRESDHSDAEDPQDKKFYLLHSLSITSPSMDASPGNTCIWTQGSPEWSGCRCNGAATVRRCELVPRRANGRLKIGRQVKTCPTQCPQVADCVGQDFILRGGLQPPPLSESIFSQLLTVAAP